MQFRLSLSHLIKQRRRVLCRRHGAAVVSIIIVALAFLACGKDTVTDPASALPGDDKVLAKVNGSSITAYDLDQAVRASLGQSAVGMLDPTGRKNVLDSLVAARAISQAQEKSLTGQERAALKRQVDAYREQLLVKRYLAKHAPKDPVTREMVADYYRKHPGQFGRKTVKRYEMISSTETLDDARRDQLLASLKDPDQHKDWSDWTKKLRQEGLPLAYTSGTADPAILSEELRGRLDKLKPEMPAALAFNNTGIALTRVIEEKEIPPQPLDHVRDRIRRILRPVQLKKSVKRVSDKVLAGADVQYMEK